MQHSAISNIFVVNEHSLAKHCPSYINMSIKYKNIHSIFTLDVKSYNNSKSFRFFLVVLLRNNTLQLKNNVQRMMKLRFQHIETTTDVTLIETYSFVIKNK